MEQQLLATSKEISSSQYNIDSTKNKGGKIKFIFEKPIVNQSSNTQKDSNIYTQKKLMKIYQEVMNLKQYVSQCRIQSPLIKQSQSKRNSEYNSYSNSHHQNWKPVGKNVQNSPKSLLCEKTQKFQPKNNFNSFENADIQQVHSPELKKTYSPKNQLLTQSTQFVRKSLKIKMKNDSDAQIKAQSFMFPSQNHGHQKSNHSQQKKGNAIKYQKENILEKNLQQKLEYEPKGQTIQNQDALQQIVYRVQNAIDQFENDKQDWINEKKQLLSVIHNLTHSSS